MRLVSYKKKSVVCLTKASIPNFSALGSPEVAVSLLSRVGGGGGGNNQVYG